jgi:type II secretory ATPase GspE/PulE/Tfp pilus assembly ATPase PilB-like protein
MSLTTVKMRRRFWIALGVLVAWWCPGAVAWAQEAAQSSSWPYQELDPDYFRAPGFYLSVGKILTCWLLFLAWIKTADWVNQDLQILHLRKIHLWNPVVVGSFSLAFLLIWILPSFALGFFLMLVAWIAPLATYIFYYRNPRLAEHQRVLTPNHLRFWAADKLKLIGIKIEAEKAGAQEQGPALQLLARGGDSEEDDQVNLMKARQLAGFTPARELLDQALRRRATAVLLDYGEQVSVRYMIDGVWHQHSPLPREKADQILIVLKKVSAIDPDQQSAKHLGRFGTTGEAGLIDCELACQMTKTGQRVLIKFEMPPQEFEAPQDLGMRDTTADKWRDLLRANRGILLFSSLPGGGLTTTVDVILRLLDRFMRDFVSVEDAKKPETEIENIDVRTYDRSAGQTPASILPAVGRTQPDVVICRDLVDAESVKILCEQATNERLVIASIQAKNSVEALLRVLMMKVPLNVFAPAIKGVLHGRMIRKLCDHCREAYTPSPELLRKLGIPAERVEHFYRVPKEPTGVCPQCDGIGYYGRTGIFELLEVDDTMRKILATKPQMDTLRKAARQAGLQTQQEHGILLVVRGVTSLEELQRVLKA